MQSHGHDTYAVLLEWISPVCANQEVKVLTAQRDCGFSSSAGPSPLDAEQPLLCASSGVGMFPQASALPARAA